MRGGLWCRFLFRSCEVFALRAKILSSTGIILKSYFLDRRFMYLIRAINAAIVIANDSANLAPRDVTVLFAISKRTDPVFGALVKFSVESSSSSLPSSSAAPSGINDTVTASA